MTEENMNILDHLDELRKRIMVVLTTFILIFIIAFIFVGDIYDWFVKDLEAIGMTLTVLGPFDIIWVYLYLAGVIAIMVSIPILLWQIWSFIRPALTKKEQKVSLLYIPFSLLLFILGLTFGYFIVRPLVLNFLIGLGEGDFQMMFTTKEYFKFVIRMTVPFSILFEMPLVIMFLTNIGVVTPEGLKRNRKYAFFGLVVISVLVSPPDFVSDVLVIIPLYILYEISIRLSALVFRKRERIDTDDR
ncbi:twin-arginine translocase subunit TatC [Texcoconibacillus texcoconensis]|uniref:Sec-independent protein translocase protein TatC n=1 Tax=Texcoconibacillus texcoconensis TaxID=1095777 RepID=A0A840QQL0_9BACI|nr:twin-arginine translocase subunit TatC [Texcoconibacillus texcoconensis]MBB5173613.1 sec-independent protein translocase protein TatC [Texcoconibacillus texcoconensis]